MVKGTEVDQSSLYHADYLQWIEATVEQLQHRDYASVDWENVIEEFKDVARRDRQALESNLVVVLTHLLKWRYQLNTTAVAGMAALLNIANEFVSFCAILPASSLI